MARKFKHESRFRGVCLLIRAGGTRFNVTLPGRDLEVDMIARFVVPPAAFGPLARLMVARRVLVEHSSTRPRPRQAFRYLTKLLVETDGHLARQSRKSASPPMLVVLCSRGVGALATLRLMGWDGIPGIFTIEGVLRERVFVVDASLLPRAAGFAGLRFMLRPDAQRTNYLAELLGDFTLPTVFRERVMEATMNKQIPASNVERLTASQRLKRDARREGRSEGRSEGRNEGRAEGARDEIVQLARLVGGEDFATVVARENDLAAMRKLLAERVARQ